MDGQRVAKNEGGKKLPWIIAGAVVGVLAAGYIGACAWAAGRDTILPNVSVAGIDVSNMTVEQAENAIEDRIEQRGCNVSFALKYEDIEESLTADQLAIDTAQSAQDAWDIGHGNFFTGGTRLVGHMLGMSGEVPLSLPEDDPALTDLMDRMKERIKRRRRGPGLPSGWIPAGDDQGDARGDGGLGDGKGPGLGKPSKHLEKWLWRA